MNNETWTLLPSDLEESGVQDLRPLSNNVLFNVSGISPDIANEALKVAMRDPINWVESNSSRFGVEDQVGSGGVFRREGGISNVIIILLSTMVAMVVGMPIL